MALCCNRLRGWSSVIGSSDVVFTLDWLTLMVKVFAECTYMVCVCISSFLNLICIYIYRIMFVSCLSTYVRFFKIHFCNSNISTKTTNEQLHASTPWTCCCFCIFVVPPSGESFCLETNRSNRWRLGNLNIKTMGWWVLMAPQQLIPLPELKKSLF